MRDARSTPARASHGESGDESGRRRRRGAAIERARRVDEDERRHVVRVARRRTSVASGRAELRPGKDERRMLAGRQQQRH